MTHAQDKLLVFYDGSCPACIKDRRFSDEKGR